MGGWCPRSGLGSPFQIGTSLPPCSEGLTGVGQEGEGQAGGGQPLSVGAQQHSDPPTPPPPAVQRKVFGTAGNTEARPKAEKRITG